jgi:hypothetical protein
MTMPWMMLLILVCMVIGAAFGGALYIAIMSFIFSFGFYVLLGLGGILVTWLVIKLIERVL